MAFIEGDEKRRDRERKLVSRYARGNASLMRGRYITRDEIEARRAALLIKGKCKWLK